MNPEHLGAILGFIGGIFSGGLTAFTTIYIYRKQNKNLEIDQIRKGKVEIIYQLLGSRYVLAEHYGASAIDVHAFNTAMALFTVYFSGNKEIMRRYDAFRIDSKNTEKLIELLKEAAKEVGLDLFDSHIKQILTVNSRPAVTIQAAPSHVFQTPGERKNV
ncbi:MAG TPA: hypothetical protein VNQ50_00140 [Xanthobacteraceae bacterium]|jgi:hypothetical protein|nr:hypothetical protein [Xanthobacteraceae bacterium]